MDKLRVYVCGHDERVNEVIDRPHIRKVDLSQLPIGKYQDNQLSESRVYFHDAIQEPVEYIGFMSYRYREKWPHLAPFQSLSKLTFAPDTVYCGNVAWPNWASWFRIYNKGIDPLFDDMVQFSGFSEHNSLTLMANTFICSWDLFQDFYREWRRIFDYLYEKYPPQSMTFETYDNSRRSGCLYEALSCLVWGHLIKEKNLNLKAMALETKTISLNKRLLLKPTR